MKVSDEDVFRSKMDGKGRVTIPADIREQWSLEHGDRVEVAVVDSNSGFVCDECGEEYGIAEVAIFNRGSDDERVVCAENCLSLEDRIIGP